MIDILLILKVPTACRRNVVKKGNNPLLYPISGESVGHVSFVKSLLIFAKFK
jgi:hypothetical protein